MKPSIKFIVISALLVFLGAGCVGSRPEKGATVAAPPAISSAPLNSIIRVTSSDPVITASLATVGSILAPQIHAGQVTYIPRPLPVVNAQAMGKFVDIAHPNSSSSPPAIILKNFQILLPPTKLFIGRAIGTDVEILYNNTVITPADMERDFKWSVGVSKVSGGVVQISHAPFSSADLSGGGLVASQEVKDTSRFTLDFQALLFGAKRATPTQTGTGYRVMPPPIAPTVSGTMFRVAPILKNITITPLTQFSGTYYIRIVPLVNGKLIAPASNQVTVVYQPTNAPQPKFSDALLYDVAITSVSPAIFPKAALFRCVEVVKNNFAPGSIFTQIFQPGYVICPQPWKGRGEEQGFGAFLDDMANFVTDVVNTVSAAYSTIKNTVVDLAVSLTGVCDISSDIKAACAKGIGAAVDVGLASMGIPPSIPNFDQLTQLGEGYVGDLAVEAVVQQTGAPCIGPCEDAVRKGIHAGVEEMKNVSANPSCVGTEEAHQYGQESLCLPSQLVVRPAPGAEFVAPVAQVTVTRRATALPSNFAGCSLLVNMRAKNHFAGGDVMGTWGSHSVPAQDIEGEPYFGAAAPLPKNLKPGESVTIPMTLGAPKLYYLPGNAPDPQSELAPKHNDWQNLYFNGQATVLAYGSFSNGRTTLDPCGFYNAYNLQLPADDN